jgi:O-acetyl-ADP-ribose deacetylase (regulator of RNase III)
MQQKLRSAVLNSLAAAEKEGFESICIPAISSGVFGYPKDQATAEIYAACAAYRGNVRVIRLISIDEETVAAFKRARDTYNTVQMPGGPGVPPPNYSATPTSTDGPYPHSEHPF